MTRLTDGKKTIEVEMNEWTDTGYTPDWSNEFFDVGFLEYDHEKEAYIVPDVEYCRIQVMDYKFRTGDFAEVSPNNNENIECEYV